MSNDLQRLEKDLRAFAKRCKDVKYTRVLLFIFLLTGLLSITAPVDSVETARRDLNTSITDMKKLFKEAKQENNKLMKGSNLELVQLMEQGDHVVKSPWSSWQYGMNYFYSDWRGVYKGRGDKKQKYPYEGIFERSNDLFLRNISPDSDLYETYTSSIAEPFSHSATTSTIKRLGGSSSYGLASTILNQEPIASIELGASVKPKNISKSPITVTPPSITVNAVTPLNTPEPPEAPELPRIEIETFNPVAPDPITVGLPTPPTFNIKLGSYCNGMAACGVSTDGGGYNTHYQGFAKTYSNDVTINNLTNGSPSLRHSWSTTGGVLLKSYFDFTTGGTATLAQNLTVDSINPLTAAERASEVAAGRTYNSGNFLLGGSRIATMDNAINGRLENTATINLAGPLVVGFEMQSDTIYGATPQQVREIKNSGTITDEVEETDTYRGTDGLGGLHVGKTGGQTVASNSDTIALSSLTGSLTNSNITVTRTPDTVDANGNILTRGGYVGYKVGMILTYENDDTRATSDYRLINNTGGNITFKGKSSIGIQVYAPGSNSTRVTVKNDGNITMGGIESYGLKLSSRVSDQNMTFENNGNINISGAGGNSLSSGIAILEDGNLSGNASIRAYTGKVLNKETINISGGDGNTGMVLINKANDNITNENAGKINVTGSKNIGMRADLGTVATDDTAARLLPTAINKGNISITNGNQNIGMVANNSDGGTTTVGTETVMKNRAVAKNEAGANILFNGVSEKGIGMFAEKGGEIINNGTIKGNNTTSLKETIGMVIQPKDGTLVANGTNAGTIELKGTKVTGVYNQGVFGMTGGSILTSGEKSISLYANNGATTKISKGSITAEDAALGLFADNTTIELGAGTGTDAPTLNASGKGT